jgi:serine/threonine protein kinase
MKPIEEEEIKKEYEFNLHDIIYIQTLGEGSFGVVDLCKFKNDPKKNYYALKKIELKNITIPKEKIEKLTKEELANIQNKIKQMRINEIEKIKHEINILYNLKERDTETGNAFCDKMLLCYRGYKHIDNGDYDIYYILTDYAEGYVELSKFTELSKFKDKLDPMIEFEKQINYFNKSRITDCIKIFGNIYNAIRKVHALGIVHRDIKPDNILYHPRKLEIKLIDFGIAENAVGNTKLEVIGTPFFIDIRILIMKYMDKSVSIELDKLKNSDIWSLGISLYTTLFDTPTGFFYEDNLYNNYNKKTNYSYMAFFESSAHVYKLYYSILNHANTKELNILDLPDNYYTEIEKSTNLTREQIHNMLLKIQMALHNLDYLYKKSNKQLPDFKSVFAPYT